MDRDVGSVAFADACDVTDHIMSLEIAMATQDKLATSAKMPRNNLQTGQLVSPNGSQQRFINDPKHWHDGLPLRLRNELSDDADIVEGTLCVCHAHHAIHEIDEPQFSGVVISVLRARDSVEIEVDSKTIFTGPAKDLQDVPRRQ